jgi:hypothetical protein
MHKATPFAGNSLAARDFALSMESSHLNMILMGGRRLAAG